MKKPFVIAIGSTNVYEGYIIKIKTDDGIEGIGEAVATPHIMGDTMGSIEGELEIFAKRLVGQEESPELLNERMISYARISKASRAAVDMALWDIIGKRGNLSIKSMIGNYRSEMETSYTVDLVDPKKATEEALDLQSQGVNVFKIKLGSGLTEDYERIKNVREAIGEGKKIYVDFNQSYSSKKAVTLSEMIEKLSIEFLEQPVPANDVRGLKFVRDHSSIPVMADEAVMSPQDAANIIYSEAADLINIKLMKSGGITDGINITKTAQSFGMPVMVGCMVETRLANTAALHLALSQSNVKYTDLDGYSSLEEDIVTGGIKFQNGRNSLPEAPGLGVSLIKSF